MRGGLSTRGRHVRAVGQCYNCQGPIYPHEARRILDSMSWDFVHPVTGATSHKERLVKRLAHRGLCEEKVRSMVERGEAERMRPMPRKAAKIPPPPIKGNQEEVKAQAEAWRPTKEGEWLSGVLIEVRDVEIPDENRTAALYQFADGQVNGEAYEEMIVWGSTVLDRLFNGDEHLGKEITLVFDGVNGRTKTFRMFAEAARRQATARRKKAPAKKKAGRKAKAKK